jgi:fused signal recognition particle receptor
MLVTPEPIDWLEATELRVVLIVGTNGSGKTTSIAKLAAYLKEQGRSVMLAAADTFRAAAGDQLEIWAQRAGVPLIGGQPGADPGSIVYDSINAALSRNIHVLLVDTAGRLQVQQCRVKKVRNVAAKADQVHRTNMAGARRDHRAECVDAGQAIQGSGGSDGRDHHQARWHGEGRYGLCCFA